MSYRLLLRKSIQLNRTNKNLFELFNNGINVCPIALHHNQFSNWSSICLSPKNHRSIFSKQIQLYNTSTLTESNESTLDEAIKQFRSEHQVFVENVKDGRNIFEFNELDMPEKLREIMAKIGYDKPTPIQAQALPILFSNLDLIGIAQTGSGKTLAYLLPAFCQLFSIHRDYWTNGRSERLKPKALILAPTRELAVQIFEVIRQFKIFKSICLYGGNDRRKQIEYLENNNPLFLVSTPGRLKDLIDARYVDLSEINYLVIDEADRMLDMGFEPQISYLIDRCPGRFDRQTMMFSASWPDEVKSFVHKYLKPEHAFISIGGTKLVANHNIQQNVLVCDTNQRYELMETILKHHPDEKTLLFCNRKIDCDRIANQFYRRLRIPSSALHGDMSQRQRESALKGFKLGQIKLLCATNVAARGLDIDDVNIVINYDFPGDIETYVHRIGRTGRKDNKGIAYSFFTDRFNSLLAKKLIEILRESNNKIPE
ncbi:ATP-dependent RNA helicase-like protein, partial [Euroglyphus maynei]